MRHIGRVLLVVLTLVLSAGPALSAAALVTHEPTLTAAPRAASPLAALAELLLYGLAAVGAIKVKDAGSIAKKFVRNAQAAGKDYEDGVKGAGADWESGAREGAENYKMAVTQAASEGRFERGIQKAGAAKYVQRASTLGPQRYGQGVAASEGAFVQGIGPVLQTIAGITLPPRRPKGDPGNMQRSQAVATALRAMKVGR